MIDKNLYDESLINELEQHILKTMNYNIKLINKPMTDYYKNEELINLNEYERMKIEFEKNNFKVCNPISFYNIDDRGELIGYDEPKFKSLHRNIKFERDNKQISFIKEWLEDPDNRTYNRIETIINGECPDYIYNDYNGKKYLNMPDDNNIENSLMYKHIKEIICSNNEKLFEYFMNWTARLFQKPDDQDNRTTLIIRSIEEGAGKDTVFNYLGHLLGERHYNNSSKIDNFFGKFNKSLLNKILVVINEATNKDKQDLIETLKDFITNNILNIQGKGVDPIKVKNICFYVFLTNNNTVMHVDPSDRRFLAFETSCSKCNDAQYFKDLYNEIKSNKYSYAFTKYFMELDIDNFDFKNNRPTTDYNDYLKETSISNIIKFIDYTIRSKNYDNKENVEFEAAKLYNLYCDYLENQGYKNKITNTKFGSELRDIIINPRELINKVKGRRFNSYVFNITNIKNYFIDKYKFNYNYDLFIDDE